MFFLSLLLQCKFANSTLLSLLSFSYFITPYDAQASSAFSALILYSGGISNSYTITLLHSERPKLYTIYTILACLSAIGLTLLDLEPPKLYGCYGGSKCSRAKELLKAVEIEGYHPWLNI